MILKIKQLCSFLLMLLSCSSFAADEQTKVPGTSVSMIKPAGFTLSETFSGYFNSQNQSSILIAEVPENAYEKLSILFNNIELARVGLAKRGVEVLEIKTLDSADINDPIIIGRQLISGIYVSKYMALFRGQKTVMVTYNILGENSLSESTVFESIKTIKLGEVASLEDKLEVLSFKFDYSLPFKLSNVIAGSAVILTTFDGTDKSGTLPLVAIGSSLSSVGAIDLKSTSHTLASSIPGFEDFKIQSEGEANFANTSGYRMEIRKADMTAIQFVAFLDDGTYLRLVSTGSSDRMMLQKEKIAEIAASVKSKT